MQLTQGTRLGRYLVQERIGAGGMGEIYRATDTRLERDVAIKRLPDGDADSQQRRRRFEREAKLVSRLAHPNICAVHDVIDHESGTYLVMELLAGETLEERLRRGPLADAELLSVAVQIADALGAAHEAGIVHRDTKPSNVMLTPQGAKLLDFGIAKAEARSDPEARTLAMGTPRPETALTKTGTTVGTLRYMSPEQLRGAAVGPATDVFAFGMMLFEMAAGEPIFECDTGAEWIAAVLREPTPDLREVSRTPLALQLAPIIDRCCRKDPQERYADGTELARELRGLQPTRATGAASGAVAALARSTGLVRRGRRAAVSLTVTLLAVSGLLVGGWLLWGLLAERPGTPSWEPKPVKRFQVNLPAELPLHPASATDGVLAVSGDSRQLVYVASLDGRSHLVLRPLDQLEGRVLAGTENAMSPFFSPDDRSVAFFTRPGSRLKRLDLETGSVRDLAGATLPIGGAWGPDDQIVFWGEFGRGLLRVPARGGAVEEITRLDDSAKDVAHVTPAFTVDGRGVLFVANRAGGAPSRLQHLDLETSRVDTLLEGHGLLQPAQLPTGHVVWARPGGLSVAESSLDATSPALGSPVPLRVEDLAEPETAPSRFAIATDGSLLYVPSSMRRPPASRRVLLLDPDGSVEALPIDPAPFLHVRLAPQGDRLVANHELDAIWLYQLDGAQTTEPRLLAGGGVLNFIPIWHPDGRSIVFTSDRDGTPNLYRLPLEPEAVPERLAPSSHLQIADQFLSDGSELLFVQRSEEGGGDIWRLDMSRPDQPVAEQVLATRFDEGYCAPSPDGSLLAYVSNATGRYEVYVATYPDLRGRLQVSTSGAGEPVWSPDGRWLHYRSGDVLWRVEVSRQPRIEVSEPTAVLERHLYRNPSEIPQLQLAPDGSRFVAIEDNELPASSVRLEVIEGWLGLVLEVIEGRRAGI
ncbi:MAG: hypothetical protein DWQ36_13525 [Acidobacteria bacterium]|nr:MAG: hypothetical protein DWQ30_12025 [Acidobacteriota bacterium]REK06231.1 MAG: hypothetical protein DWQ36_13525 [Acidobacteriota bacterium]